jgi:hypothetical protein
MESEEAEHIKELSLDLAKAMSAVIPDETDTRIVMYAAGILAAQAIALLCDSGEKIDSTVEWFKKYLLDASKDYRGLHGKSH